MATSWLNRPSTYTKFTKKSESNLSLETLFMKLYQKAKYTDQIIILRDHIQDITIKVHRSLLIASCKYFRKMWKFEGSTTTNPLIIIVEDAFIAQKIIEEFYGLEYHPDTTHNKLTYMVIRDFFSLTNNHEELFEMEFEEDMLDLLLRVVYTFKPNDDLARLLNKIFKGNNFFQISLEMANLMRRNNQRYDIIMRTNENGAFLWNTLENKYLDLVKESAHCIAYSADATQIVILTEYLFSYKKNINIRCTLSGNILHDFSFDAGYSGPLCISPDHTKVVTRIGLNEISIRDLTNMVNHTKITYNGTEVPMFSFTPNGKYFIINSNGPIHIYENQSLNLVKYIYESKSHTPSQIVSPNSQFYAYNLNSSLVIISLENFEKIRTLGTNIFEAAYTADSTKIITYCTDNILRVWDASGKLLNEIKWLKATIKSIKCPDLLYIIVATEDSSIHFLDATSYEIMRSEKLDKNICSMAIRSC